MEGGDESRHLHRYFNPLQIAKRTRIHFENSCMLASFWRYFPLISFESIVQMTNNNGGGGGGSNNSV